MTFEHIEDVPTLIDLPVRGNENGRQYQLPSGQWVPSVTTVLSFFKADALEDWRIRVGHETAQDIAKRAAYRGTKLHTFCEQYLTNVLLNYRGMLPHDLELFKQVKVHLNEISEIRHIEAPLYSETLRLAGRTDCIGNFRGKLSVIDFKTSTWAKKEQWIQAYFEQAAAYALMYEEMTGIPIEQLVILIVSENEGAAQVFVKETKDYKDALMYTVYKYHECLADIPF